MSCANGLEGMAERNANFARCDEVELVALTDCGDCPGLVAPRVKLLAEVTKNLGRPFDAVHLGTCVKLAMETAACPINVGELQVVMQARFGVPLRLGTHTY